MELLRISFPHISTNADANILSKFLYKKKGRNRKKEDEYTPVVKAEFGESSREDEVYFLVLCNPNGIP